MRNNPNNHHRKNIRLKNYNYSDNGYYFITICVKDRIKLLGEIIDIGDVGVGVLDDPQMQLSEIGHIVDKHINSINNAYENIIIDEYVIMPNHIHMICIINNPGKGSSRTPTPTNATIPFLVSTFKRFTNRECEFPIWQRNYYEHIIRNEKSYLKIKEYIINNPILWDKDCYNK